ncbi:hypothetical protein [Dyadobacter sp. Leaf189]|uniref:hypothetical protein n=1 Tax=Dyadobacter sp. Leaf189 TaxID=1736295 RepID=UPI0006FF153F|nr:hypothetical protein [Dyadobacter sp. Leaf189]KQS30954.1 hypothetical protein ASG33_11360 [Dyadobacter sp. Leaf189]
MQKIRLFSQYDPDALILKTRKEVQDQVGQWPEEYLSSEKLGEHVDALKQRHEMFLPDIDFANGRAVMIERIYPLSVYQPGSKPDVKVRVNVLIYKYPFKAQTYLLGCRPPVPVPDCEGEWYADQINQEIYLEYPQYDKRPKKTIIAHNNYIAQLQPCYVALQDEARRFNAGLDSMIEEAVLQRRNDIDHMKRLLSMLS